MKTQNLLQRYRGVSSNGQCHSLDLLAPASFVRDLAPLAGRKNSPSTKEGDGRPVAGARAASGRGVAYMMSAHVLTTSTGAGLKVGFKFGEFCSCCCLPLLPQCATKLSQLGAHVLAQP